MVKIGIVRQTTNGPVEGIELTSSLGEKYYAFKGIPFAEPPITGLDHNDEKVDRRFKAPIPLKRTWSENLKTHNFKGFCVESVITPQIVETSEDCLYVNVYVPASGSENKNVLVWIHGGAFSRGNAGDMLFGPDFLLSEDNIVVTVQYRQGIFGFLNLGYGEYTGNMGLKDQKLALKWVHENIENFSGNRNEILLFGLSSGGASVGYHLLNEKSRRYFNRAFIISSSALSFYALNEANHLQRMKDFAKTNDADELIEYLKTENKTVLAESFPMGRVTKTGVLPWAPTIEHPDVVDGFITKIPEEIYNSDSAPVMDVMFSFTSQESIKLHPEWIGYRKPLIKENVEDSEVVLPFKGFNRSAFPKEYDQAMILLREAYYSDLSNDDEIDRANFELVSNIMFVDSIIKTVILQANVNNKNKGTKAGNDKSTFLYRFSLDAGLNRGKIGQSLKYEGATHGDDICYIFHCHSFDKMNLYEKHLQQKDATYDAIMRLVRMITNFARVGNPSITQDTPFKPCKSSVYCQEISNDPKSSVTTNIKEQKKYDTWREVERIYKSAVTPNQEYVPSSIE